MDTIREMSERTERAMLCEKAALSCESKGRAHFEEKCELRTEFQRDRDRIIHSKAFRRSNIKTQVFLSPESDHYRTRLTHTLEVAQIARTIARAMRVNENITEAVALGHDLGHTPFGHAGERALDKLTEGGFTHFEQSARVCEKLERSGKGLNLTYEVLDGIRHHTRGEWASTLEGKIVRVSDRVAYINHDIDDAVRAGVLSEEELPARVVEVLGRSKSERIDTLVKSIIRNSDTDIKMDSDVEICYDMLHKFLFEAVYSNPKAKSEESKVGDIVEGLFEHFTKHPEKLLDEYKIICDTEGAERAAADYIAGMTDHYAVLSYSDIYIPKFWKL